MEHMSAEERELRSAIAKCIRCEDKVCGTQILDERAALERDLANIILATDMTGMLVYLIRCRKLSERRRAEGLDELAYQFYGSISWEELKYSISRPPQPQQ